MAVRRIALLTILAGWLLAIPAVATAAAEYDQGLTTISTGAR
jgi:hypothetical protein